MGSRDVSARARGARDKPEWWWLGSWEVVRNDAEPQYVSNITWLRRIYFSTEESCLASVVRSLVLHRAVPGGSSPECTIKPHHLNHNTAATNSSRAVRRMKLRPQVCVSHVHTRISHR